MELKQETGGAAVLGVQRGESEGWIERKRKEEELVWFWLEKIYEQRRKEKKNTEEWEKPQGWKTKLLNNGGKDTAEMRVEDDDELKLGAEGKI